MGKRKKSGRAPPSKKKGAGLPTVFSCLFCNHEQSVTVKLDKKAGIGQLNCKVCGQSFQSDINYLSAAVDVYYDWLDAAENVAKGEAEAADRTEERAGPSKTKSGGPGGQNTYVEKTRGDDFVVDDESDNGGDFGDDDD